VRRAIASLLLLAGLAAASTAPVAEPLTRKQALTALKDRDPAVRRAAVTRLGEVGTMADVSALVEDLHDADQGVRGTAEDAIEKVWGKSGDEMIDALYRRGVEQMDDGDTDDAIATFSLIISKKPDFAESWNKRATLYYLIGDYEKSLRDCGEVIKRNPLHFGALAGYGLIYMKLDQPERALEYFRRAFAINPNLDDVAAHIRALERLIDEKQQRYI